MAVQLTSVSLVLHRRLHSDELGSLLSQFLGPSPTLSLSTACTFRSPKLLDWIWGLSCGPLVRRPPGWSLCGFLRSEQCYHYWQLWKCLKFVAETGDMELLRWIFRHFSGCAVGVEVVQLAAHHGHLEVLEFLLQHDTARYWKRQWVEMPAENKDDVWHESTPVLPKGWNGPGLLVDWGGKSLLLAVLNDHRDVARWLVENAPHHHSEHELKVVIEAALTKGDMELAELLVPAGKNLLDYAPFSPQPEVIEMLLDSGYLRQDRECAAYSLCELASEGRLDLMQRIMMLYSPPPPTNDFNWLKPWYRAVRNAITAGDLSMLKWLVQHPTGEDLCVMFNTHQQGYLNNFFALAAQAGNLEMVEYLFQNGGYGQVEGALFQAADQGHLKVVKWLLRNFSFNNPESVDEVINTAASTGRVEILRFLHGVDVDKFAGLWSHNAMDVAAAEGHLAVVQWLHENRSEGCSTKAMDDAAANGHLAVVKWLHQNRSEGCTAAAMDEAASHGYLDVVKWLHINTKAPCTTKAMEEAAKNGHLDVVKWLFQHRSERCTVDALVGAIEHSHVKVVWWLRHHLPQLTPPKQQYWIQAPNQFDMIFLLGKFYPVFFDLGNPRRPIMGIQSEPNDAYILSWLQQTFPSVDLCSLQHPTA